MNSPGNVSFTEWLCWYWGSLADRLLRRLRYRWTRVAEPPDRLSPRIVYIVGQGGHLWSAEFLCPCGCGATVRLSLHKEGRPRWTVQTHRDGRVSLSPSIWRKVGCRSHFFITDGLIKYA